MTATVIASPVSDTATLCVPLTACRLRATARFATALRSAAEPRSAFEQWDRSRRWQNARYAVLSRALSPFFQSSHAWLGAPRDLGLPIMGAFPPLRAFMEHVLAGDW